MLQDSQIIGGDHVLPKALNERLFRPSRVYAKQPTLNAQVLVHQRLQNVLHLACCHHFGAWLLLTLCVPCDVCTAIASRDQAVKMSSHTRQAKNLVSNCVLLTVKGVLFQ